MFDITFTIKQLAQICHTSTRTLRYYEQLGLIQAKRLENNYRVYDLNILDRIEMIGTLKQSGLTLQQIKETLGNPKMMNEVLSKQKEMLKLKMKDLEKSIAFVDHQMHIHQLYQQYGTDEPIIQEAETPQIEIIRKVQKEDMIILMEYENIKLAVDVYDHFQKYIVNPTKNTAKKTTALYFYHINEEESSKGEAFNSYFEKFKASLENKNYQIASLVCAYSYGLINEGIRCLWAEVQKTSDE